MICARFNLLELIVVLSASFAFPIGANGTERRTNMNTNLIANRKVGVIGIGSMGRLIARRLFESGYNLTAYNRDRAKADALVARISASVDRATPFLCLRRF